MSQQSRDHKQGRYVEYGNQTGQLLYGEDQEGGGENLAETLIIGNESGGTDLEMTAGDSIVGSAGVVVVDADLVVDGKLTVTGLIDPTGLIFTEAPAPSTAPQEGGIFVSDGSGGLVQNDLYYRRESDGALINLTAALSAVNYIGTWDADTNNPALGNGGAGGDQGDYYVVNVAGSTPIDGISDWEIGDWIINNGAVWQKVDNTDQVTSVNGQQGAVSLGLQHILPIGNTTGGNDIEMSAGDKIVSPIGQDIELEPGAGGEIVLDADTTVDGELKATDLILDEAPAPSTAAAEGGFFVSDGSGGLVQNDPYYRPESDGAPVSLLGGGGGGGGGLYEETYVTWVGPNQTGAADDNDLNTPFITIQGAIDALSNAGIWASGAAGGLTRAQILVSSGLYDEDLRIPQAPGTGDVFLVLTAVGPVTLGDGILSNFGSSVPRSITWWNDQAAEDAGSDAPGGNGRRPTLVLNAIGGSSGESSSTHTGYSGGWVISGSILLAGGALPSTTVELHLEHVEVQDEIRKDSVDPHEGILNCYFYRCEIDTFDHSDAYFNVIDSCRFRSTINAGYYGRLTQCFFEHDITFADASSFPLPPQGFFECSFDKMPNGDGVTITLTDGGFWLADEITNANFENQLGGGVLVSATLALLDGFLNQAVALVNPNTYMAVNDNSLATPFVTIQGAINAIQDLGQGGQVLVSPGTYNETLFITKSNPGFPLSLKGLGADRGDVIVAPTSPNRPGLVLADATLPTLIPWVSDPANYENNYEDLDPNGNFVTGVTVEDIQFVGQGINAGWGIVIAGVAEQMSASFSRVAALNSGGQSRGCWCSDGDTSWSLCAVLGGMLMVNDSDPLLRHCSVDWLEARDDCHPQAEYTRFGNNPGSQDAIYYLGNAGTAVRRFRSCHFAGDVHLDDVSRIDIWGGTIETDIDCADGCVFDCNDVHTGGNITIGAVGGALSCPYLGGRYMGVLTDPGGRINRVIGA